MSDHSRYGFVLVAIVILALLVATLKFIRSVPPHLVRWSQGRGFQILRFRQKAFFTGPYNWLFTTAFDRLNDLVVYFVRVRDREGQERSCWILCSSDFKSATGEDNSAIEVVEEKWV